MKVEDIIEPVKITIVVNNLRIKIYLLLILLKKYFKEDSP